MALFGVGGQTTSIRNGYDREVETTGRTLSDATYFRCDILRKPVMLRVNGLAAEVNSTDQEHGRRTRDGVGVEKMLSLFLLKAGRS